MTKAPHWHKHVTGTHGQNIVWLHGWGYDHTGFDRIATLFQKDSISTQFDLPGFGETPALFKGASTADYAEALAAQLDQTSSHILIGHSYGGRLAVQVAARYPNLVKAIVLIGGAGLPRKRSLGFKAKALFLKLVGKAAHMIDAVVGTNLRSAYVARFGSQDYKNAGELRATLVSAVTENLANQARQITCPALLLYGSDDTDTPGEIGKAYERLIPVSRYTELKGYNHHDILTRGAYQCEALIKGFLKDLKND